MTQQNAFARSRGIVTGEHDLVLRDRTVRIAATSVTPNFFTVLGVQAAHGRVFDRGDESVREPLVVISDALWHRELGGDPAVVGRTITLTDSAPRVPRTFVVAGVLPRGVHFTYPVEVEAWMLMRWAEVERYSPFVIGFTAMTRLRPELPWVRAERLVAGAPTGLSSAVPERMQKQRKIRLEPMHDWIVGETRPSLLLLGGVAALLLVVTCVTVSNGLLARVSERRQELAARSALGASRLRLVRQVVVEGALLSIGGVIGGIALAVAVQPLLRTLLPASVPRIGELGVDTSLLAFGAVVAVLTTIIAAAAPAWGGTRVEATTLLARSGTTASASRSAVRWRHGLVAAQAAVATALLIASTLLLASFWRVGHVPLGFDGDEVLTADLHLLDERGYWRWSIAQFQDELTTRLRAVPGVAEVGVTSTVPFGGDIGGRPFCYLPPCVDPRPAQFARARYVDPGFFRTLHIAAVRGRLLDASDRLGGRSVIVVSESFARRRFGAENPLGRTVDEAGNVEIVGVVPDLRYDRRDREPVPAIYVPQAQELSPLLNVVVRPRPGVEAASLVPALRRALREIDPVLPTLRINTIGALVDRSGTARRFYTVATTAFAVVALLLTIVGLLVVVTRVVEERRQELAIRAALGATMRALARVAARDTLGAVGAGVVCGVMGAYAGAVVLAQFLFEVTPRSPATYAIVALLVGGVTVVAAWGPVRRFERRSLVAMLRAE